MDLLPINTAGFSSFIETVLHIIGQRETSDLKTFHLHFDKFEIVLAIYLAITKLANKSCKRPTLMEHGTWLGRNTRKKRSNECRASCKKEEMLKSGSKNGFLICAGRSWQCKLKPVFI